MQIKSIEWEFLEDILQISECCNLVRYSHDNSTYFSLRYVEHASDYWHSGDETDIDLSEDDVMNMIRFLRGENVQ